MSTVSERSKVPDSLAPPAMPVAARPAAKIVGTGHYAPARVVTNADLEKMVDTSDAWITERTGIKQRHLAADGELTSDMAAEAAKKALASAGISADQLDMIIIGTISGDMPMPACAAFVQQKIGARHCPAFDLSAACAGFVFGLSIAEKFVRTGAARYVLVVGVELLSRIIDWTDRTTCVLFGDGAGAVIVGPCSAEEADAGRGILSTHIFTDGSLAPALQIPGGGSREPFSAEVLEKRRHLVHMQGQDVFKAAVRYLSAASKAALDAHGLTGKDLDWVVAHQANMRILQGVSQRLEIPMERFFINIHKYGNTSSASIGIALDEALAEGKIAPGQTILMCALGAGISWGSALVRW
jgi:3-oxoacyl-[acyl-carrier-protein] synthase-3